MSSSPLFLLSFVPIVLVVAGLAVGLTLAFVRRDQLGSKAFTLAVVGMIFMIISELSGVVWTAGGVVQALGEEFGYHRFGMLVVVYSTISRVLFLTGLGLLIGAVFTGRPRRQSPPLS